MQRSNFFLRTKLLPPRAIPELLARPRLTERLATNLSAPVTLVMADAGCGKTTLVAEFVRSLPRELVWYQLDHTDSDPFVFLGYIAHGIRRFVPNFGETLLSYLNEATDDLLRYPERAVDLLLNEILESIEQPFILVLDDYHHLGRETMVHRLVERLLTYSSDMLHVIITTRDLPPLAVVRRRSQSAVLLVDRDDLLFTDAEVNDLFKQTLDVELKPEELTEYRERTHGWVTALQLVRQLVEQNNPSFRKSEIDWREVLRSGEKDIFDYFAEEVFAAESIDVQRLLPRLALLESLQLNVCSQLYPEMRSSAILPDLVQRNVFITVAGDGRGSEEYRLHPLFRDFLRRRLRTETGRTGVIGEHQRIAEYFLSRENWEGALDHLLEAEDYLRAAEIIAERGGEWLASGAIVSLGMRAAEIPPEALNAFPCALVHQADVARLQGDNERAVALLNRAIGHLAEKADHKGEAEAWHSLAALARRAGNFAEALAHLERAEALVDERSAVRMKCENTRGLCFIATGEWTRAEHQFRLALELAESLGDERYIRLITHNLGMPAGLRGDFGEALRWLGRLLDNEKKDVGLPQEAIGHLNVARLHLYRGEFAESQKHLEQSLELCQLYNLKSLRAEVFEAFGNFHREKRDFAHAVEFYERARKAYQDAGIAVANRELDEERAALALMQEDLPAARALLENLIAARQAGANEIGLYTARLGLCRVRLQQQDLQNLSGELKDIAAYFHEHNHPYNEAQAAAALATAYFLENNRQNALPHLRRTLDLAARYDYDYWLRGEVGRNPVLFADEDIAERLPIDLREQVAARAVKLSKVFAESAVVKSSTAAPAAAVTAETVVDLTVRVLGPVEIFRDSVRPFAPDAWTTRRARDIFCYISTSKHRRVEKDTLIDQFWGDDDFDVIEKNFHPTISLIRKALNSRQTLKQNFLLYRDGAYGLNPEFSYLIDTEEFDRLLEEADAARRSGDETAYLENFKLAGKKYRGEFMPGIYDDWVTEPRNYYRQQYLRVLETLANDALEKKEWNDALVFANDILRDDPFREDIHCLVMRVYAAQGKRAAVKDQFDSLRKLLRKELGVEPVAETRRAFQELFK